MGALVQATPAAAAPANDDFAAREALSGTSTSVGGTTVDATLETGEPPHFAGDSSVWYSWIAPETAVLQLDTCAPGSAGPAKVQLYTGSAVTALAEVQPRSDSPNCPGFGAGDLRRFNVTAGTTYAISVIEYAADTTFTLVLSATPSPSNDNFTAALDLAEALDVDVDGTTVGATLEPGEPDYFGGSGDGNSVWYRWTAPKRTRAWIDNCNAQSDSRVTVYRGTAVDSLSPVGPHYGDPSPPGCEGDGLFGSREEFLATAGTTYMIRVYTDLYEEGGFHLRMRDILFDGSLHQTGSKAKIRKGKTVTYTVDIENLGTVPIDPAVDLVTSRPDRLGKPVKRTKYVSLDATHGNCKPVTFFAVHRGAICDIELDPGESSRITARVKPTESLSHWAFLDYAHGADTPIYDEQTANEDEDPVNTRVKRKRKRRR